MTTDTSSGAATLLPATTPPPVGARAIERMQETGKLGTNWWMIPEAWDLVERLCARFAGSDMVPEEYRGKPGNVFVALSAGLPIGLSPLGCLQSVAIVNGHPRLYGDGPVAVVMAHAEFVSIDEKVVGTLNDDDRCWTFTVKRKVRSGVVQSIERSYSIEDAKRAKLWLREGRNGQPTPWVTAPDVMLKNRARTFALRDSFADVLQGVALYADRFDDAAADVKDASFVVRDAAGAEAPEAGKVQVAQDGFGGAAAAEPNKRNPKHTKKAPKKPELGDTFSGDGGMHVFAGDPLAAVLWSKLSAEQLQQLVMGVEPHAELRDVMKAHTEILQRAQANASPPADPSSSAAAAPPGELGKDGVPRHLPAWATLPQLDGKLAIVDVNPSRKVGVWLFTRPFEVGSIPVGDKSDLAVRLLPGNADVPQFLVFHAGVWSVLPSPAASEVEIARKGVSRSLTEWANAAKIASTAQLVAMAEKDRGEVAGEPWKSLGDMSVRTLVCLRARVYAAAQAAKEGAK